MGEYRLLVFSRLVPLKKIADLARHCVLQCGNKLECGLERDLGC